MSSDHHPLPEDGSLSEIIAAYLDALDGGERPDPEQLMARHPEHADALRDFLATQERLESLARPFTSESAQDRS